MVKRFLSLLLVASLIACNDKLPASNPNEDEEKTVKDKDDDEHSDEKDKKKNQQELEQLHGWTTDQKENATTQLFNWITKKDGGHNSTDDRNYVTACTINKIAAAMTYADFKTVMSAVELDIQNPNDQVLSMKIADFNSFLKDCIHENDTK